MAEKQGFALLLVFIYIERHTGQLEIKRTLTPLAAFAIAFAVSLPCIAQYFLNSVTIKPCMVRNWQKCCETGQRSPVKLFSSLPGRPLLTVLLLVHTLAREPGFGVPLDDTDTQKNV